jgi:hypothetical protein
MSSIEEIAKNFITKITEAIDYDTDGLKGITGAVNLIRRA